jgi:hypothetical protein
MDHADAAADSLKYAAEAELGSDTERYRLAVAQVQALLDVAAAIREQTSQLILPLEVAEVTDA